MAQPVVQVIEEATGETLYTVRWPSPILQLPVYGPGTYTVNVGRDRPDGAMRAGTPSRTVATAAN